ncbi:hypothetical protein [Pseudomonas sp. R5(2019)]|uniref:hypothetical protein n=1 Tax=Pseudomonas sp. R5(2019) TaxID=2697566 RepID=UPI0021157958|nr:hypothetical protein [Pseudomonas sp. R5(2019)]
MTLQFNIQYLGLLQTDRSGSVVREQQAAKSRVISYTPYGYRLPGEAKPMLGFNGQFKERGMIGYVLGAAIGCLTRY